MPYFTTAELRAMPNMDNLDKYTDPALTSAASWIESVIERKCGTSFISRSHTETHDGDAANCAGSIILKHPFPRSVTSITSNGVAFTAPELADVVIDGSRLLRRSSGSYASLRAWDSGVQNIAVVYEAGYSSTPPGDVKTAALDAARDWLLRKYGQQGASDRAISMQTEFGNTVYASASDKYDRPTGLPDVDAVIMGWANRLDVFGFA